MPITKSGSLTLFMTLIMAMVLQIYPVPESIEWWRPAWLLMAIIYWIMALPTRVGILTAWMSGLILDVGMGSTLGVHGASFAVCAYLVYSLSNRLRLFTLWQQSLLVGLLAGFDLVVSLWIENFIQYRAHDARYWLPMISSTLFWPIVFIILRQVRRSYHIR